MKGLPRMRLLWDDATAAEAAGPTLDLSVRLDFEGAQANAFHLPAATEETFAAGGFVGDVRLGGSANCRVLTLAPHGNGTHTESVAHLRADGPSVVEAVPTDPVLARVLHVALRPLGSTGEPVPGTSAPDDRVVTAGALAEALERAPGPAGVACVACVLHASLGDGRGPRRTWSGSNPPYLTPAAARWLRAQGFDHLVTNLPSVDREEDGGGLHAHHLFFGVERGAAALPPEARRRTITEMAALDRTTPGWGLLQLHVPPFVSDAAPSRPLYTPCRILDDVPVSRAPEPQP